MQRSVAQAIVQGVIGLSTSALWAQVKQRVEEAVEIITVFGTETLQCRREFLALQRRSRHRQKLATLGSEGQLLELIVVIDHPCSLAVEVEPRRIRLQRLPCYRKEEGLRISINSESFGTIAIPKHSAIFGGTVAAFLVE